MTSYLGYVKSDVKLCLQSIPADAKRPLDVRVMLEELRRLCARHNGRLLLVWAQILHETGYFSSPTWDRLHNPAGLKKLSGSGFVNYYNGVDAARAMMSHVAAYCPGAGWDELIEPKLDPRWEIARSLAIAYASADKWTIERIGKDWAEDGRYVEKVLGIFHRLLSPAAAEFLPVLIVAGHRNLSGGNPKEADRTDDAARAFLAALRERGIAAEWWQQVDGDSDPDDSMSYLASVAIGCNDWLARQPRGGIMLDLHHEGGGAAGVFSIFPDWPGDERNALDRRYGLEIATAISRQTGLPLRAAGAVSPGLMSERQTGVGAAGYRLGMFNLTAPVRDKCVRLVVELGALDVPSDLAIIKGPEFYARAARAAVEAIMWVQRS